MEKIVITIPISHPEHRLRLAGEGLEAQWLRNVITQTNPFYSGDTRLICARDRIRRAFSYASWNEFIDKSFSWLATPEKHDFWQEIAYKPY